MHTPDLSVVLLSYNRVDLTRRAVEQILGTTTGVDFELLVVDNASTDGTSEYLGTLTDPRTRVLQQDQNRWFGGGSNVGLDECRGRYVLLTQNDMTFAPDSFSTLLTMGRTLPNAGCVGIGGGFINGAGRIFEVSDWWENPVRLFDYMPVDFNSACCMLLERAFANTHGIRFDEHYRLYWEDVDLSHQVTEAGRVVYMVNNRLVGTRHLRSATITTLLGVDARERIRAESETHYRSKWQRLLQDPARRVSAISYAWVFPGLRLVPVPEYEFTREAVAEHGTDAVATAPYEFLEVQEDYAAAIDGYKALIGQNPENVMAYRNLCRAVSRASLPPSKSAEVATTVTKFLRSRPPAVVRQALFVLIQDAVLQIADRLARDERYTDALVHYQEIYEIAQTTRAIATCELQIAKMTYLIGDIDAADQRLREWVIKNDTADLPTNYRTSARYYLGEIAVRKGRVALAREQFGAVLAIDEHHRAAARRLAQLPVANAN